MKFCFHKWDLSAKEPDGWVLSRLGGEYRRCLKCGLWQARLRPPANADFWQTIQVPFPQTGPDTGGGA
jgi:hypothetical protein